MNWAVVGNDNWIRPTALISEAISAPHLPSEEADGLKLASVAVKGKFLDRLARCERVKRFISCDPRRRTRARSLRNSQQSHTLLTRLPNFYLITVICDTAYFRIICLP
ncbi:hypothetical protein AVEN_242897-1 [Araneus ventricosus]|uniref:Uncharacterized protein n=1 Tax=Araneus ventricosus TaxID=182803 RepID=A0A4Y2RZ06_ARAVE|nr:hypothetical protein AVEN_242897-1 [Araneus ventricosus]